MDYNRLSFFHPRVKMVCPTTRKTRRFSPALATRPTRAPFL
jgi:hypothetical protein